MSLESQIIVEPWFVYSKYLSKKTGLEIWILDYGGTSTGTHKFPKFIEPVKNARDEGKEIYLFLNPIVDSREKDVKNPSRGSGIDAAELAVAAYHPDAQVVEVVHSPTPKFTLENVSEKNPERKRVIWGLDLENEFWGKERLENHFANIMGTTYKANVEGGIAAHDFLRQRGLDFGKCVDITNLEDYACYMYSPKQVEEFGRFDYEVGSVGSGERALGAIISLKDKKTKHILVVPYSHTLDPFHFDKETDAKRLQSSFEVETHNKIKQISDNNPKILYKTFGETFGGKKAQELILDPAAKADGQNIVTGPDGAAAFTILRGAFDLPNIRCKSPGKGLRIFNVNNFSNGAFNYLNNAYIPLGSSVLIVNTGLSNNLMYKHWVEKGR